MALELRASHGHSLRLDIVGYQFPDGTVDSLNWLLLRFTVQVPGQEPWTKVDPSLETRELLSLARWFEGMGDANMRGHRPSIFFTEPNLSFSLVPVKGGKRRLRVHLDAESRPPWAPPRGQGVYSNAWVEFPLEELDSKALAHWAREEHARFPPRESPWD
ncbi:hypothetical protein SAMN05443572_102408 [Myxococcus fulvus]|uniref:Uncharacterized protein n=1 Tax=Myxococcus fulvus TaxID=33 RepID=A0A511SX36_MYXFU|nr:hypothetical protein [Myxococcus fulvus]AKF86795.1 hypothetical protein MFUL124B02_33330 [Myxococcus fulvus 124B02]GEN06479.1 hypothetical protein MFU01_15160 [Myxococcus fulvus]SET47416.1 hypothetical protein SAMN05443572_102408 [Myxococcus fulvus]